MTDNTHLDALVRQALAELPLPDNEQSRQALSTVLARSGRTVSARRLQPSWLTPLLAATAVALVATLTGFVLSRSTQPASEPSDQPTSSLTGGWSRDLTGSEVRGWDGRWRMVLAPKGVLTLRAPGADTISTEGASYAVTADRLRVDAFVNGVCDELPAGTYAWSLRGGTLTLRLVDDPCAARVDIFAGRWASVGNPTPR